MTEPDARRSVGQWILRRFDVVLLAVIAYLPALATKPGRMPSDTKLFLYLDPGRLIADAPFTWDTRQFGGWVPHQTIAYLWPQGPWYWLFEQLRMPDWVAHRLWIGTLLFVAALGVRWVGRMLGLTCGGALAAAVVYQLSPYLLPYVSRTSAMLLPWAALGWIVGLTIRTATGRHPWRHAALLGLVLLSCSAVNATAVLMIAPAPVLWLLHASLQHTVTWRRALASAGRIGVLATAVSLWWMAMLSTQGRYGADVLSYSESLQATSLTSVSSETLRGLGYWLFYVRDPYAFTTTASLDYMESGVVIAIGFALVLLCLVGLCATRWSQRRYAALLVLVGIVLAVGVHPIDDPSPLMSPLAENSRSSLSLAIRSSTRALPMSNLGLALGIGALVTAIARAGWRPRWRLHVVLPALVVLLAVANLPALFDGGLVDPALERDENPPAAWADAAGDLSDTSSEYRVLELPGAEFGAFRWGYTVDPPLPGLTTKPLVTRDLLPLGSPGVMDLLYALDDRVQNGTLDPAALAPVARLLGVDTIWLAGDIAYDRFRNPRPQSVEQLLDDAPALGDPVEYGEPIVNVPDVAMIDEHVLAQGPDSEVAPVVLYTVDDPSAIVRASNEVIVLVGSGDGVIDAAAAGLVDGDEAIIYAADLDDAMLQGATALVIVTDSNRDRAHHWRSSQDVTGFTERGGPGADVQRTDEGDQRLPVFDGEQDAAAQTVAFLEGGLVVRATGYGEPFAYRPEQRPAMAVDGLASTAWVVGDRVDPVGESISASETGGSLTLLQPVGTGATRMITSVRLHVAGAAIDVALDESSLVEPGQHVELPHDGEVRIEITGVGARAGGADSGASAVGFAELGIGAHQEVVRVPAIPAIDAPVAIVLTRERVDPLDRWRSDPERSLVREVTLLADASFTQTATLRLNARADDAVIGQLLQMTGATSNRRLAGDPESRASSAVDGDAATAWTSPFNAAIGSMLTIPLSGEPIGAWTLQQPIDELHSVITSVHVTVGSAAFDLDVPAPDADGVSQLPALGDVPTGGPMTLTVTGIAPRTTVDRRYAEATTLPVAIIELGGVPALETVTPELRECSTNLLSVDGNPVPLAVDDDVVRRLLAGEAVDVPTCQGSPLALAAGTHRIESAAGVDTGIDVDRFVMTELAEPAGDGAPAPAVTVERTRLTRTATVAPCPDGCWLILGEGFNTGWDATLDGASLGEPLQISGGFNGWWLPPSTESRVVEMEWTAQRPVTFAIALSFVAVVLCVVLALRRRNEPDPAWVSEPPTVDRPVLGTSPLRVGSVAAIALVVGAAVLASPLMGLVAVVPAAAIVVTRRPRVGGVLGVLLLGAIAARILRNQLAYRYPANAAWPTIWDGSHKYGVLVVVLIAVAALGSDDGRDSDGGEHHE